MGYHRAGFEVVGVDILPMRDYPFEFHQSDALTFPLEGFDAIHASPPCQAFSMMTRIHKNSHEHPDLVDSIRQRLKASGVPYVIENVAGSPLKTHVMLCGTMFGLKIARHRYFETSFEMPLLMPPCQHSDDMFDPYHYNRKNSEFRRVMETPWIRDGGGGGRKGTVAQAIPPAYTEYIGRELLRVTARHNIRS
jgi:DNA (cytosine-5)-methyltransferase 1